MDNSILYFLSKSLNFILSFSILVIVHEFGHFITARWIGCRVDRFYIFFHPWFSLWKKKIGNTEYGLGWVPFGGYVKIAGMVDESMDTKSLDKDPEPWEFRSKKPWQKIIVMSAGVVFNLLLAWLIYIGVTWVNGDSYVANKDLKNGLSFSQVAKEFGFKDGDIVVAVGGDAVDNYITIAKKIVFLEAKTATVLRDGNRVQLAIPEGFVSRLAESNKGINNNFFAVPRTVPVVSSVSKEARFVQGSLRESDEILEINHKSVFFPNLAEAISMVKDSVVNIVVNRHGSKQVVIARLNQEGKIGIAFSPSNIKLTTKHYSFLAAIAHGSSLAVNSIIDFFAQINLLLFSKEVKVKESLGSVISIWKIFPSEVNFHGFFMLTALLSVMIGLFNLLPVPGLDGGHIVFAIYEWVVGKPVPQKVLEYAQMVGIFLLVGLMVYGLGLDIGRLFR